MGPGVGMGLLSLLDCCPQTVPSLLKRVRLWREICACAYKDGAIPVGETYFWKRGTIYTCQSHDNHVIMQYQVLAQVHHVIICGQIMRLIY